MGRLRDGMRRLAERLGEVEGRSVTYTRGEATVVVTAIIGRVPVVVRERLSGEASFVSRNRDYILTVPSELAEFGLPADGDRIVDTDPDDGGTFELRPLEGEPSWRWCDGYGSALRLHTLKVG